MSQTIEVIVDDEGRILIPSALRSRLGLATGTTLVVEEDDQGAARLSVQGSEPLLVDEDGILVVTSQLPEDFDFSDFFQQEREARMQKFFEKAGS